MTARWQTDSWMLTHKVTRREIIESHITPIEDIDEHTIELCAAVEGDEQSCECSPSVEVDDDGNFLIIHNAFDGREIIERLEATQDE